MSMLIDELQRLADDPRSWIVVAIMALVAARSLFLFLRCPYASGTIVIDDDAVRHARENPFTPGARFGVMMVLGVSLTLLGLFMLYRGIHPTISLAAMAMGILIVQTEPARLRIRENIERIIANRDADEAFVGGARHRLKISHQELTVMNVVVLAALTAGLLVF